MTLRPVAASDADLLFRLFASTREPELALTGLPAAQIDALLRMQFDAQDRQYRAAHPGAEDSVVLVAGRPAGRLRVAREDGALLLLDIVLLSEHRGRGIGTALIRDLQAEAASAGAPLRLHVALTNPATSLYLRLGFLPEGGGDVYQAMAWTAVTVAGAAG
jgi:ribosomal protein S18 acetylase RimI-like enzyme